MLSEASTLQLKATKTDVLFRMLDSFNQDSVHVTVTWNLTNIAYCMSVFGLFHSSECHKEVYTTSIIYDCEILPNYSVYP